MNLQKINNFFSLEKLTLQTFLRIIFIIIIFIFNFITQPQDNETIILKTTFVMLSILLSFVMLALIKFYKRKTFLLYLQIFIDLLSTTIIILLVKQNNFLITFLYLLSITNAAIILFRTGAFIGALSSSVLTVSVYYIISQISLKNFEYYNILQNSIYSIVIYFSYATIISVFTENLSQKDELLYQKELELNIEKKIKNTIIDKMYSGIIVVNPEYQIIFINQNGMKILNLEDYKNMSLTTLIPEIKNLSDASKQEINYQDRILGLTVTNFENTTDFIEGKIIIFKDITEEINLREMIKNQEKLAYLGKISALIAHEIRNPLASISASLQIIPRFINKDPSKIEKLTNIGLKEINRLTNLINEFLDYARLDKINVSNTDLAGILEEIKDLYEIKEGENLKFIFNEIKEAPIIGDNDKLKQIFINLIKNAFEAIENNEKKVEVTLMEDFNHYIVTVKDNGKGINQEDLKNIFDPFFTTKKNGTGLGLSLVNKFISLHKGKIDIKTEEGKGSEFIIYLPKIKREENG